jgi:hypothetical protein
MQRLGIGIGLDYSAPVSVGVLGRAGTSGPAAPNAPVLSLNSAVAGLMTFNWDVDDTVSTGDTLTRQVATDIGFSTIIDNTSHVITSGENTANQITASQYQAPANGTYYVRGTVTSALTGKTSVASNILTVVVADMAASSDDNDYAAWMAAA